MKKYLQLIRIKHYIKNILVFVPLIFSGQLLNIDMFLKNLITFISFCLISSTIYIINDIKDVEEDRKNPSKQNRPIASGKVKVKHALIIAVIFFIISVSLLLLIKDIQSIIKCELFILLYFALNIAYSMGLKNKPIIDVVILVSGFFIRVLIGGAASNIQISDWLYLTVMSISLFLALGKRRNELIKNTKKDTRKVLKYYNKDFLDKNMYMCMALAICFYSLWTTQNHNHLMIWTVPMVIIIALCYSLDIENSESYGDPIEVIYKNKKIIVMGVIYVLFTIFALYR